MRIFSAAGYNLTTAYGILQAGGSATVVIGAALSLVGQIPPGLVILCVISLHNGQIRASHVKRNIIIGLIATFGIISILTAPVADLVMLAFISIVELYAHFPPVTKRSKEAAKRAAEISSADFEKYLQSKGLKLKRREKFPISIAVLLAISLISVLGNTAPWLASEEITLTNSKPVTGYVLSVSPTFTAVLLPGDGGITYINTVDITGRKICIIGFTGLAWRSLPELTTPSPYRSCPLWGKRR
jgi:hypothetical protein